MAPACCIVFLSPLQYDGGFLRLGAAFCLQLFWAIAYHLNRAQRRFTDWALVVKCSGAAGFNGEFRNLFWFPRFPRRVGWGIISA